MNLDYLYGINPVDESRDGREDVGELLSGVHCGAFRCCDARPPGDTTEA